MPGCLLSRSIGELILCSHAPSPLHAHTHKHGPLRPSFHVGVSIYFYSEKEKNVYGFMRET